jgi:multidrug efflux pump
MLSRFFIDRPIFAWVIAIVIMLAGTAAILNLPIQQYPAIAEPQIGISATYPGASAQAIEDSVTQVIEQKMKGLDGLKYMSSSSDEAGTASVVLTFQIGTNIDIAQVQVQNKLQAAVPLLPQEVQAQGLYVQKTARNFLMTISVYSDDPKVTSTDIGDYLASNVIDPVSRVAGVGETINFGSQHAMRIWLDPAKLAARSLVPADVVSAIRAQNTQVTAGQIGGLPATAGVGLNATITAQSRLQTPEQFQHVLLKANAGGAAVYLADVARVELGAESYAFSALYLGHPASGVAVRLAPGANALETAVDELTARLPRGNPLRLDALCTLIDPRGRQNAHRSDRSRVFGDVPVPAEFSGDPHSNHRRTGGSTGYLGCFGRVRLYDQYTHPIRSRISHRPVGRRCDCSGGERRTRHARGGAIGN